MRDYREQSTVESILTLTFSLLSTVLLLALLRIIHMCYQHWRVDNNDTRRY